MNSASTNSDDDRGSDPSRVLALSDGVFAIILTLLVLEIHVPDLGQGQTLDHALRESRPSFEAFIISFVVVAIAWAGHRDLFALVRRTDRTLVWLNMLYLLPLSLVPFGASLLARYNREPVALEMYGVLLVAITITRLAAWIYATGRPHLLITPIDVQSRRTGAAIVAVPGIAYAVASVLADSIPTATIAIFYAVPILYFITIALLRASAPPQSAEREFT
jgi:TMEM175 potassium channel family protein